MSTTSPDDPIQLQNAFKKINYLKEDIRRLSDELRRKETQLSSFSEELQRQEAMLSNYTDLAMEQSKQISTLSAAIQNTILWDSTCPRPAASSTPSPLWTEADVPGGQLGFIPADDNNRGCHPTIVCLCDPHSSYGYLPSGSSSSQCMVQLSPQPSGRLQRWMHQRLPPPGNRHHRPACLLPRLGTGLCPDGCNCLDPRLPLSASELQLEEYSLPLATVQTGRWLRGLTVVPSVNPSLPAVSF
ncbi:unnamed protein product [Arctogadus glacialis]